jgi:muramoyltetrapeptide carboxypeptidase
VKTKIPGGPLRPGDGVALINPAGMPPVRFARQYDYIQEYILALGFRLKDHVVVDWEDPRARAQALGRAFADPEVRAILPICGGDRIYEVLPLIDYEEIARHPKIICGSSKLSTLVAAIAERSNFVTFFGPHLNFLNPKASMQEAGFTVRSFWNMLQWDWHGRNQLAKNEAYHFFAAPRNGELPVRMRNIYREPQRILEDRRRDNFYHALDPARSVTGELLPGSLPPFLLMCELGLAPNVSGKILMLDTLDSGIDEVMRMLRELGRYCDLPGAAALVFSSLSERSDRAVPLLPELRERRRIEALLVEASACAGGIPVFHGFPFGHCAYKLTVPVGIPLTIEAATGDLLLHGSPY